MSLAKKGGDGFSAEYQSAIHHTSKNDDAELFSASVVGGTAWLFARPDFEQSFEYLFVDEAGQVSVANVVAMGTCAKNIILVGDPMQLPQPIQGAHPGESGLSVFSQATTPFHLTGASFFQCRAECTPRFAGSSPTMSMKAA